jgi:hypothetical protein
MFLTPKFERQGYDPRPIAHNLKRLFVATPEPRRGPEKWRKLLRLWGVSPVHIKYSQLVAIYAVPMLEIYSRASATPWREMGLI